MIYRSNLTAPDLQPFFRHTVCRVMGHSFGHDVLSDFTDKADDDPVFGIHKQSGFWTHDEAAILYNAARQRPGWWLDIGGATGWTGAHLAATGCHVIALDPMYAVPDFADRAEENLKATGFNGRVILIPKTSDDYLIGSMNRFAGVVVDGQHSAPYPLRDAVGASMRIAPDGIILFHDAIGEPVKAGYRLLQQLGWTVKIYRTPHLVALCYRGDFMPPEHSPDPNLPVYVL